MSDVAIVPAAPLLLPSHSGLTDPFPELRAAARTAVEWLVARGPSRIVLLTSVPIPANRARGVEASWGEKVGRHLLTEASYDGPLTVALQPGPLPALDGAAVLVVADGSARRGEKAPGHLDPRAAGFDDTLTAALATGDVAELAALDLPLADELLCYGARALAALGSLVPAPADPRLDFSDDPFGVQYWVARWPGAADRDAVERMDP